MFPVSICWPLSYILASTFRQTGVHTDKFSSGVFTINFFFLLHVRLLQMFFLPQVIFWGLWEEQQLTMETVWTICTCTDLCLICCPSQRHQSDCCSRDERRLLRKEDKCEGKEQEGEKEKERYSVFFSFLIDKLMWGLPVCLVVFSGPPDFMKWHYYHCRCFWMHAIVTTNDYKTQMIFPGMANTHVHVSSTKCNIDAWLYLHGSFFGLRSAIPSVGMALPPVGGRGSATHKWAWYILESFSPPLFQVISWFVLVSELTDNAEWPQMSSEKSECWWITATLTVSWCIFRRRGHESSQNLTLKNKRKET